MFKLVMGLILVASIRALAADDGLAIHEKLSGPNSKVQSFRINFENSKSKTYGFKKAESAEEILREKALNSDDKALKVRTYEYLRAVALVRSVETGSRSAVLDQEVILNTFNKLSPAELKDLNAVLVSYTSRVRSGEPVGQLTLYKAGKQLSKVALLEQAHLITAQEDATYSNSLLYTSGSTH